MNGEKNVCVSSTPDQFFNAKFDSVAYVRWKLILKILERTDVGATVAPILVKSEQMDMARSSFSSSSRLFGFGRDCRLSTQWIPYVDSVHNNKFRTRIYAVWFCKRKWSSAVCADHISLLHRNHPFTKVGIRSPLHFPIIWFSAAALVKPYLEALLF